MGLRSTWRFFSSIWNSYPWGCRAWYSFMRVSSSEFFCPVSTRLQASRTVRVSM